MWVVALPVVGARVLVSHGWTYAAKVVDARGVYLKVLGSISGYAAEARWVPAASCRMLGA